MFLNRELTLWLLVFNRKVFIDPVAPNYWLTLWDPRELHNLDVCLMY